MSTDRDVLSYNPFQGDFGDGEIMLSDKMVVSRKEHVCFICAGPIAVGERVRALTEARRDKVITTRFCAPCCAAMAISWTDAGRAIEERTSIGMSARGQLPGVSA